MQAALEPLMKGRTTIAIAHGSDDPERRRDLRGGPRRIVERGTHAELLERGGLYARLYEQQFRSGLIQAECEDGVILATGEVVRTASG